jgi:hypothetical protein
MLYVLYVCLKVMPLNLCGCASSNGITCCDIWQKRINTHLSFENCGYLLFYYLPNCKYFCFVNVFFYNKFYLNKQCLLSNYFYQPPYFKFIDLSLRWKLTYLAFRHLFQAMCISMANYWQWKMSKLEDVKTHHSMKEK